MLKGKKKLLAAQVLLGLMVSGNAYAADGTINNSVAIGDAGHFAIIGKPSNVPTAERDMRALGADYVYDFENWYIPNGTLTVDGCASGFTGSKMSIAVGGGSVVAFGGTGVTGKTVNIGNIGDAQSFSNFTLSNSSGGGNTLNIYNIAGTCSQDSGYGKIMNEDGSYSYAAKGDVIGTSTVEYSNNGIGTISAGDNASDVMNIYNAGVNNTLKGARNLEFKAGKINVLGKDLTVGALVGADINITGNNVTVGNYRSGDGDNVRINNGQVKATGNVNITGNNFKANEVDAADGQVSVSGSGADVKVVKANTLTIGANGTLKTDNLNNINKVFIDGAANSNALVTTDVISTPADKIKLVNSTDTTSSKLLVQESKLNIGTNGVTVSKSVTGTQERSKSVVETQIASLAGVITSADLLSNAGFSNASQAVQQSNAEGGSAREMVPYAAVGYGNMRQESGSYVDVQGSAFNIGFAKEVKNGSGKLLFGPMIEYGRGSYESYLDDGTKGDGNTQNFGLGVMARQNNDNGTYYEGSLRYGKLTSNYNSGDLGADYDTDANYWGAHFGLGKVFQLNDKNSIDTYCKFFYTNQGSSSANILGSNVEFDAVKSKRSRLGFRFNHATSDVRSIYAGLAWQHEFDGSACATVDGFSAPSPSIKGNSMMVELGVNVAPKSSPVSFDLGVSGWAGKQKGYSLNANMLWSF